MRAQVGLAAALAALGAPLAAAPVGTSIVQRTGAYIIGASCPTVGDGYFNTVTRSFCLTPPGTILNGGTPVAGEQGFEQVHATDTGARTELSGSLDDATTPFPVNTSAKAYAELQGPLSLPQIGVYASAGREGVGYASAAGSQKYVYEGDAAAAFALDMNLTYAFMGRTDPLPNGFPYYGEVTARLALLSGDYVPSGSIDFSDADGLSCGDANVVAVVPFRGTSGSTGAVTLGTDCSGNALAVQPGQEFWIYAFFSGLAYRLGITDGFSTLRVDLSDSLTDAQRAALVGGLTPLEAVPEPGVLGLLGLGALALGIRRRRTS